jgi:polyprenyl-phospho-N-acetylgalactosaminyl synthase
MDASYCAIVPTFCNPVTVRDVVEGIRNYGVPVVLVDDGSAEKGRDVCRELEREGLVTLRRFEVNRGKGAATLEGLRIVRDLGFSHAFQVDADSQHDLTQIPAFLQASRGQPLALVLSYPVYTSAAPRARVWGRLATTFWIAIEVGSAKVIRDALCGFRIYPVQEALLSKSRCQRMCFDPEIAVLLVRRGVPTVNLPVRVTYLSVAEGGVSHYRLFLDNFALGLLHTRLCVLGLVGLISKPFVNYARGRKA